MVRDGRAGGRSPRESAERTTDESIEPILNDGIDRALRRVFEQLPSRLLALVEDVDRVDQRDPDSVADRRDRLADCEECFEQSVDFRLRRVNRLSNREAAERFIEEKNLFEFRVTTRATFRLPLLFRL